MSILHRPLIEGDPLGPCADDCGVCASLPMSRRSTREAGRVRLEKRLRELGKLSDAKLVDVLLGCNPLGGYSVAQVKRFRRGYEDTVCRYEQLIPVGKGRADVLR